LHDPQQPDHAGLDEDPADVDTEGGFAESEAEIWLFQRRAHRTTLPNGGD
jgi:hypothetical protein